MASAEDRGRRAGAGKAGDEPRRAGIRQGTGAGGTEAGGTRASGHTLTGHDFPGRTGWRQRVT